MSLAIECGATHTIAIYLQNNGDNKVKRFHFGPANFKLMKETQLESFLNEIKNTTSSLIINKLAIAMAGIIADQDKKVVRKVLNKVWTNLDDIWIGNDIETALNCIDGKYTIKCIVICGTGSCCYGTNGEITTKIGGYGHILGDWGSGYSISHHALREALKDYEQNHFKDKENHEDKSVLLNLILKQLNMNSLYELVGWSLCASKSEIADLAQLIIRQWKYGNKVAAKVVTRAIDELSTDIITLVNKLRDGKNIEDKAIKIGFTGSLLNKNDEFSNAMKVKLRENKLNAEIVILKETVMGALKMIGKEKAVQTLIENASEYIQCNEQLKKILPIPTSLSVTEQRNEKSMNLDTMSVTDSINLMINEESGIYKAIRCHVASIEKLIQRITHAFRSGGRLFYVGAGTSGRLGILDASECPPTFKSPQHWVQGIIAGGPKALQSSIEGAEDSIIDGINAIEQRNINDNDVVVGIAACGRTPFVWGSLFFAQQRKAFTCLLTFNPNLKFNLTPDLIIAINVGPEVLTGSTRLKSGSATKCVLNMLTTLSMVQYGKCLENLMIDLMPVNQKLRDRSLRITLLIVNNDELNKDLAERILIKNNYDIKRTVTELRQMIKENNFIK